MGQSPPGSTYNEDQDGLPFYQGRKDFGFRFPVRRVFCTAPSRVAQAGDTLVTVRAPVGALNMAREECCIGRGVASVRHRSGARSYTYYGIATLTPEFTSFDSQGTVFGALTKTSFASIRIMAPSDNIVRAFESLAGPLDAEIQALDEQAETLASLRNALLPKLLSGELRIDDPERFLEEAALT